MTQHETSKKPNRRPRRSSEEWLREVKRWRASGQSRGEYAAAHGLNPARLSWWASELQDDEQGARSKRFLAVRVAPTTSVQHVPSPSPRRSAPELGQTVEIELGDGVRVRVAANLDATTLASVIRTIKGAV